MARIAAIEAATFPLSAKTHPARDELHALLDACLLLAELAQAGPPEGQMRDPALSAGRRVGAALFRSALGWTEEYELPANLCPQTPLVWRIETARRLRSTPSLLPPDVIAQLTDALEALNNGTGALPRLLTPEPKAGRGSDPIGARQCEDTMLWWIEHQKAAGRSAGSAYIEVAAAAGVSVKAVEKWRSAALKDLGKIFNEIADLAREAGEQGEPFPCGEDGWTLAGAGKRWRECKS